MNTWSGAGRNLHTDEPHVPGSPLFVQRCGTSPPPICAVAAYPGPVGELVQREIRAHLDFGHRFRQRHGTGRTAGAGRARRGTGRSGIGYQTGVNAGRTVVDERRGGRGRYLLPPTGPVLALSGTTGTTACALPEVEGAGAAAGNARHRALRASGSASRTRTCCSSGSRRRRARPGCWGPTPERATVHGRGRT